MSNSKRWVLLHHVGAPDDPNGSHFDFLLEDEIDCRTWRLSEFPDLDSPAVLAISSPAHKLSWLEKREAIVSGGRGWAKSIKHGTFDGFLPVDQSLAIDVRLMGNDLRARLQIHAENFQLSSI